MRLSRRTFLRHYIAPAAAVGVAGSLQPSVLTASAQPTNGAGQFFINIVLAGGADGLFMFPPLGASFNLLKARRTAIMDGLSLSDCQIPGVSSDLGMHPRFQWRPAGLSVSVADMVGLGEARILGCLGMGQRNGSHDIAMATLLTGLGNWTSGTSGHWVARWMDRYQMEQTQVWRLGRQVGLPLTREGPLPITLEALSSYQLNDRGAALGGSDESARSFDIARRLLELQSDLRPHAEQLRTALKQSIETGDSIWPYRSQQIRTDYTQAHGDPFKDAARIIKRKVATSDQSVTYIQITLDGFDNHSRLREALGAAGDGTAGWGWGYNKIIAHNLAVLRAELGASTWAKTVVALSTEFGRAIETRSESGSDHGFANNLLVLSGGLRSGGGPMAGSAPTANQIANDDVLTTAVDQRQTFWEILEFLGHDPESVFTDFTPGPRLALFS